MRGLQSLIEQGFGKFGNVLQPRKGTRQLVLRVVQAALAGKHCFAQVRCSIGEPWRLTIQALLGQHALAQALPVLRLHSSGPGR